MPPSSQIYAWLAFSYMLLLRHCHFLSSPPRRIAVSTWRMRLLLPDFTRSADIHALFLVPLQSLILVSEASRCSDFCIEPTDKVMLSMLLQSLVLCLHTFTGNHKSWIQRNGRWCVNFGAHFTTDSTDLADLRVRMVTGRSSFAIYRKHLLFLPHDHSQRDPNSRVHSLTGRGKSKRDE